MFSETKWQRFEHTCFQNFFHTHMVEHSRLHDLRACYRQSKAHIFKKKKKLILTNFVDNYTKLIQLQENYLKTCVHWCTPKLLDGFNCKSKSEDNGRKRSWGAFLGSQHSRMGLGRLTSTSLTHTDLHKPNNKLVHA
jgi:hypothetical protein